MKEIIRPEVEESKDDIDIPMWIYVVGAISAAVIWIGFFIMKLHNM